MITFLPPTTNYIQCNLMEAFFGPGIRYPGLISVRLTSLPSVKTFTLTPTQTLMTLIQTVMTLIQTLMTLIQTVMTLIQTLMTLTVEKNKSERPKKASIKLHRTSRQWRRAFRRVGRVWDSRAVPLLLTN